MGFDIHSLPDLYAPDRERIVLAMRRQSAVWRGQKPDRWPMLTGGVLSPAQELIPAPDFRDAFNSHDLMLCGEVRKACVVANGRSDMVPSARGNYGTGTLLSCLGLEQEVFPDKMPWLKAHLTRDQVADLIPDDVRVRGTFSRGLDYMQFHRKIMGDRLPLYCMDTQGPFDLAHLVLGDDIFYAIFDDPDLVHHLLEICLQMGIKTHEWMKEAAGEPRDRLHHSNSLYADNMGVRICEDTSAILGPDAIREFALPYTQRLARHFGGAWVHYCGRNDALTEGLLEIPEVRGINFGHIPGHEHDHPFEIDMQRCADHHKVYFGGWPRLPGESAHEYLDRLYEWASRGHLIPQVAAPLDNAFPTAESILEYWYGLQA